jgi:probable rRNA maturation factor
VDSRGYVVLISIDERFAAALSEERLAAIARRVLEAERAPACELSIAVTDDETVRALNREYAGEDTVTDVLSFSQREGEEFAAPPEGVPPLGEVVIAYPQAARQASGGVAGQAAEGEALRQAQGERKWDAAKGERGSDAAKGEHEWSVEREVEWLLVHGVLHLLGYDHAEPEEARRMRGREEALVNG